MMIWRLHADSVGTEWFASEAELEAVAQTGRWARVRSYFKHVDCFDVAEGEFIDFLNDNCR